MNKMLRGTILRDDGSNTGVEEWCYSGSDSDYFTSKNTTSALAQVCHSHCSNAVVGLFIQQKTGQSRVSPTPTGASVKHWLYFEIKLIYEAMISFLQGAVVCMIKDWCCA